MDAARFDTLARSIIRSASRRTALRLLATSAVSGHISGLLVHRTAAHDLSKKCKKKAGRAKKKCLRKAKKHKAQHAAEPLLTYECPGTSQLNLDFGGDERVAQSFTAAQSGSLHEIQFDIFKAAGSTGAYVVELLDFGIDGKPTNDVLATATIPNAAVPEGNSTPTASFAGLPLVAGSEYVAALSRPGAVFHCATRSDADCVGNGFVQEPRGTGQFSPGPNIVVSVIVLV